MKVTERTRNLAQFAKGQSTASMTQKSDIAKYNSMDKRATTGVDSDQGRKNQTLLVSKPSKVLLQ